MAEVPSTWTCLPEFYADGFTCDCDCGAVDPDCAVPENPIANCDSAFPVCTDGVCDPGIPVPDEWACSPSYWNAGDGCDCGCGPEGIRDPDCDRPGTLWFCQSGQFCNDLGQCEDTAAPTATIITMFPTAAPTADLTDWTCPEEYYNDGYSCDCECGKIDPDCAIEGAPVFNCDTLQTCSSEGVCEGGIIDIPVPDGWNCPPAYWNANDGCDCGCGDEGIRDPDCDREGTLWFCPDEGDWFCNDLGQCEELIVTTPTFTITYFPTTSPTSSGTGGPTPTASPVSPVPTPTTGPVPTPAPVPTTTPAPGGGASEEDIILLVIAAVVFVIALAIFCMVACKVVSSKTTVTTTSAKKQAMNPMLEETKAGPLVG